MMTARSHVPSTSDAELMERAQCDDRSAFAALYGRYWIRALRVAGVMGSDKCDAPVIVRDAFAFAWQIREEYRPDAGTVHSWIFGIVRDHAAGDYADRVANDFDGFGSIEIVSDLACSHDEPTDSAIGNVAADAVIEMLQEVPAAQREVIAQAFFGELSSKEIARYLGLPEESVAGRVHFGLDDLRTRNFT